MSAASFNKVQLGALLMEAGFISEPQLNSALSIQSTQGGKIGEILVRMGYIDESALLKVLSNQMNLPFIDLKHYQIKPDIIRKIPERLARRHKLLLIDEIANYYLVGMTDPTDIIAYDELNSILGSNVRIAVVTESDVSRIIDLVYRRTQEISSFAAKLKEEMGEASEGISEAEMIGAQAAPVAKLLDSIFEDAVQMGASDIHIEPNENSLRIRQRVDGVLNEDIVHGKEVVSALVLRIKLIARLNISERRLPQDGRFKIEVKGRQIDVRVSVLPVHYGESVVMRLLDQTAGILNLDQLGIPAVILERLKYLIERPSSMVLVTGPTGSGKTTTLYAALSVLNKKEVNIITIEDPIEYTLPRVNQVQVNPLIDLTFPNVLRSVLRQDPDIIMVGEMRDEATVTIGLRAAITGHLVLSTLHTTDAVSTAIRLVDLGAPGFLVASALRGVMGQRLARKVCSACAKKYKPTQQEEAALVSLIGKRDPSFSFKQGEGCSRCNHTGYRGRIGVYELMEMDGPMADALRISDTRLFTQLAYAQENYRPLTLAALDYANQGITTLQEVFRIGNEVQGIHRI